MEKEEEIEPTAQKEENSEIIEQTEHKEENSEKIECSISKTEFNFNQKPRLLSCTDFGNVFSKGCKWSPDGLCVLLCTEDQNLRIFDLPPNLSKDPKNDLEAAVKVKEGENVYDFQWYPPMNSNDPDTCCFATTSRCQPIHLYDAFDGHIRATYRCFDHLDEMVAARSLNFDPTGHKLIAGLKNQIRIFDVNVPGRDCESFSTFTKEDGGLSGIISSIAFNPVMPEVFALASYSKDMAVYLDPRAQLLCVLEGQKGGITHIKFSPDGTKLLAGARKDDEISVWDMRNPGTLYSTLNRTVQTNQRIYFDVSSDGKYVISGSTNGTVQAWDLESGKEIGKFDMHQDCVNGLDIHPYLPYLATSSGQRHMDKCMEMSDDEDDDQKTVENTMKLWELMQINED